MKNKIIREAVYKNSGNNMVGNQTAIVIINGIKMYSEIPESEGHADYINLILSSMKESADLENLASVEDAILKIIKETNSPISQNCIIRIIDDEFNIIGDCCPETIINKTWELVENKKINVDYSDDLCYPIFSRK